MTEAAGTDTRHGTRQPQERDLTRGLLETFHSEQTCSVNALHPDPNNHTKTILFTTTIINYDTVWPTLKQFLVALTS